MQRAQTPLQSFNEGCDKVSTKAVRGTPALHVNYRAVLLLTLTRQMPLTFRCHFVAGAWQSSWSAVVLLLMPSPLLRGLPCWPSCGSLGVQQQLRRLLPTLQLPASWLCRLHHRQSLLPYRCAAMPASLRLPAMPWLMLLASLERGSGNAASAVPCGRRASHQCERASLFLQCKHDS